MDIRLFVVIVAVALAWLVVLFLFGGAAGKVHPWLGVLLLLACFVTIVAGLLHILGAVGLVGFDLWRDVFPSISLPRISVVLDIWLALAIAGALLFVWTLGERNKETLRMIGVLAFSLGLIVWGFNILARNAIEALARFVR